MSFSLVLIVTWQISSQSSSSDCSSMLLVCGSEADFLTFLTRFLILSHLEHRGDVMVKIEYHSMKPVSRDRYSWLKLLPTHRHQKQLLLLLPLLSRQPMLRKRPHFHPQLCSPISCEVFVPYLARDLVDFTIYTTQQVFSHQITCTAALQAVTCCAPARYPNLKLQKLRGRCEAWYQILRCKRMVDPKDLVYYKLQI